MLFSGTVDGRADLLLSVARSPFLPNSCIWERSESLWFSNPDKGTGFDPFLHQFHRVRSRIQLIHLSARVSSLYHLLLQELFFSLFIEQVVNQEVPQESKSLKVNERPNFVA